MAILVANNATSYLAGTLTAVATSLTVSSGTGTLFPTISGSDVFYVTLTNTSNQNEIVKVTAKATDTFTIVRAQDGTSARAFAIGDKVELRVIKVVFDDKASLTNDQTFSGTNVFSGSTTTDLVRITQTGTGNAFVVEDSTNPDVSPFAIVASGNVGIGTTSPQAKLSVSNAGAAGLEFFTNYPGGGVGTYIQSYNRSGTAYVSTAYDATDHSFRTSGTERMFLNSSGSVGIGSASLSNINLRVSKTLTGGSNAFGYFSDSAVQSDVTLGAFYFSTSATAASGTLGNVNHFRASQASFGTATFLNQFGFIAENSLLGATNNYGFIASDTAAVTAGKTAYGFYSAVNTATGGGTTYGFYAVGTAPNYFNGNVGINETNPTHELTVGGTASATYFNLGGNTASAPAVDAAITRPANGTLAFIANAAERLRIGSSGQIGIGGANYGTSGQILTSGGAAAAPSWADAPASGATGGGSDAVFVLNDKTITTSYTIASTKNASSVGPLTINRYVRKRILVII